MTELNPNYENIPSPSDQTQAAAPTANPWHAVAQSLWRPAASDELAFMQGKGAVTTSQEIDQIKKEVGQGAKDPEQALILAAKNNRVVGIGDIHGPLGPHMAQLAEEMPALKAAGVTHLAVEIPTQFQTQVNNWSAADQTFLHDRLKDKGSLIDVIDAAKKSGIKVEAVDEYYNANGEKLASRDRTMAKNIEGILQDPDAKVAYFVGAEHLQDGFRMDSFGPSAVDILRRRHISVKTFLPQIASSEDGLMPIARDLNKAVSVSRGDVPSVAAIKNSAGTTYDKWDNIVFYPTDYKMDAVKAELGKFGQDPAAQLTAAVAGKPVVLLGEMRSLESEQAESPHRKFVAGLMPDLKRAGLTNLAVDLPASYQNILDDFEKSGQFKGPLHDTYDRADFRAVLSAARQAGVKLTAIGLQNEYTTPAVDILDHLTISAENIAGHDGQKHVLVWCPEEKLANFPDDQGNIFSVKASLAKNGIDSASFAAFNQDFTDTSLGLVTGVTPRPLTFDPAQTKLLKDVPNTLSLPMQLFDNVIVYPSP